MTIAALGGEPEFAEVEGAQVLGADSADVVSKSLFKLFGFWTALGSCTHKKDLFKSLTSCGEILYHNNTTSFLPHSPSSLTMLRCNVNSRLARERRGKQRQKEINLEIS